MIAKSRAWLVVLLHWTVRKVPPPPVLAPLEVEVLRSLGMPLLAAVAMPAKSYALALMGLHMRGLVRAGPWDAPVLTEAGRRALTEAEWRALGRACPVERGHG